MRGVKARRATSAFSTVEAATSAAPLTFGINGPHAVYDAASGRTFIAFLGLERDLYVVSYDHFTGDTDGPVEVGAYPIADDNDHGAPTLAIDSDGYLHVVWGSHNSAHQHSVSDSPRDISAWTTAAVTGASGTYPNLVVTDGGDLLLFDRAGTGHAGSFPAHEYIGVRASSDGGATWGTYTAIVDTTGSPEAASDAYLSAVSYVDGLVHLTWIVARGAAHDGTRTNVYHATYDPDTGTLANAAGTSLGTSIVWSEHSDCLVYSGSPIYTARHLVLPSGRIMVAYQVGTISSGEAGSFSLHVAVWDGSTWTDTDLGIARTWAFADAALRQYGPAVMVLAVSDSGGLADVEAWRTAADDGVLWTSVGTLLRGSSGKGYSRLAPVGSGPWVGLAQQMPADWDRTSATASDLLPLVAVAEPAGSTATAGGDADTLEGQDGAYYLDRANHTGSQTASTISDLDTAVRDAGRWEVVVSGNPAAATTTPDGSDWVYGWVSS